MSDQTIEENTDLAKVLATSLLYLKKEIARIDSLVETRLGEFSELSQQSILTAKQDAITEAVSQAKPDLPETLVYETHLNEVKYNFDVALNSIKTKLDFEHEYIREHTHDRDYASLNHTHESLASKEHTHENYSLSDHIHENYALMEHGHENYLTIESFNEEQTRNNSQLNSLVNAIEDINHLIEETVSTVRHELNEDTAAWNENVSVINQSQEQLKTELSETIQSQTNKLRESLNDVDSRHIELNETVSSDISVLRGWVDSQLNTIISTTRELADNKADINHAHPDLASLSSVQDVNAVAQSNVAKIANINKIMLDYETELKNKMNVSEGLMRADLDSMIKRVKDLVVAEIPDPKDGEDGLEWEFKFHEHQRNILMYKRSDQTEWKHQDLSPKYNDNQVQPLDNQFTPSSGGGLVENVIATSPSSIYYDEFGQIVFGRYATTYRVGVTDENGYWEVDITNMNFEVVTEAIASGEMIGISSNPNLTPVERKIDYQVESISLTKITGYAFQQREMTHLAGNEDFGTETAGAGYNVTCRITGSIAPETTVEP